MKKYSTIKKCISLLIPLFTVACAVLLLKFPTVLGLTPDRVILVVLALIGVEFLIEKLCYLEHIPEISAKLSRIQAQMRTFGRRGDFGSTEDMIRAAKREILISGITLNGIVNVAELLEEKLKERVTVRLLALDTDSNLVAKCAEYFGEDPTTMRKHLDANLRNLHARLRANSRSVEIRTVSHRPAFGYAAIDPKGSHGFLRVESYTCRSGQVTRPMMQFQKMAQPEQFALYYEDLMRLWTLGKPYEPRPLD